MNNNLVTISCYVFKNASKSWTNTTKAWKIGDNQYCQDLNFDPVDDILVPVASTVQYAPKQTAQSKSSDRLAEQDITSPEKTGETMTGALESTGFENARCLPAKKRQTDPTACFDSVISYYQTGATSQKFRIQKPQQHSESGKERQRVNVVAGSFPEPVKGIKKRSLAIAINARTREIGWMCDDILNDTREIIEFRPDGFFLHEDSSHQQIVHHEGDPFMVITSKILPSPVGTHEKYEKREESLLPLIELEIVNLRTGYSNWVSPLPLKIKLLPRFYRKTKSRLRFSDTFLVLPTAELSLFSHWKRTKERAKGSIDAVDIDTFRLITLSYDNVCPLEERDILRYDEIYAWNNPSYNLKRTDYISQRMAGNYAANTLSTFSDYLHLIEDKQHKFLPPLLSTDIMKKQTMMSTLDLKSRPTLNLDPPPHGSSSEYIPQLSHTDSLTDMPSPKDTTGKPCPTSTTPQNDKYEWGSDSDDMVLYYEMKESGDSASSEYTALTNPVPIVDSNEENIESPYFMGISGSKMLQSAFLIPQLATSESNIQEFPEYYAEHTFPET